MVNPEKRQSTDGDDLDRPDQISDGQNSSTGSPTTTLDQPITRRLRDIFTGDDDVDLLMQRSDREDGFLQWLRALDMQVMGACRSDERLKPLLKLNASATAEDDGLLAHLSQHFEPSEVCMLARCLCIPLVSVRVGKICQNGTLLSPTAVRGNLCLTLLPNSDMRVSFNGDNGSVEKLSTLNTASHCTDMEIKEISADSSERSFFIRTPESISYYWCSEKSKLLGDELLRKMKELLIQKPSLADLTGINKSRIDCFGTQIRAYLSELVTNDGSSDSFDRCRPQSSFQCQKSLRSKQATNQVSKSNPISSLSPRPSSFKENLQKSFSTVRNLSREKSRQRYVSLADLTASYCSSSSSLQKDKLPEVSAPNSYISSSPFNGLDILTNPSDFPFSSSENGTPLLVSLPVSPHYCWCPPVPSTLHHHPLSSEPLSLPPLSSKPLLTFAEIPPLDFPTIMPESLLNFSASQQIPTFTPLMSDPIVHIPMIDFCSSGQGYLVSAGPGPALSSSLVDPLLPNAESVIEKGARETLRMLISSSNQPKQQIFEMFPRVLGSAGVDIPNVLVTGSRGLYCGTRDVDGISKSKGLVVLSEKSRYNGDDLGEQNEKSYSSCDSDEGID